MFNVTVLLDSNKHTYSFDVTKSLVMASSAMAAQNYFEYADMKNAPFQRCSEWFLNKKKKKIKSLPV